MKLGDRAAILPREIFSCRSFSSSACCFICASMMLMPRMMRLPPCILVIFMFTYIGVPVSVMR